MQTKLLQTAHGGQAFGCKEDRVKLTVVMQTKVLQKKVRLTEIRQTEIRKTKVKLPGIMQTKLWQTTHGGQEVRKTGSSLQGSCRRRSGR
jgi:hypothetical protein